jgi:glycosyltransferase involved in cell wall biosynthesis
MNVPEIQLSVALVTRNRPDSLNRCLKSLRSQNVQPFEIVISDDSDLELAPQTKTIAEHWNCRYIEGPRRGLYANRNHAALVCEGTHIRTMDDDHEFPEQHFEKCISSIKSDPEVIWIIGEYLPSEKIREEPHPCPGELHPRGFSIPPHDTQHSWAISDGASIYPKVIFDIGIMYVEYFKFGLAYLEFGSRLHWLRYRIRHLESTYVIHYFDPQNRSFMLENINLSSRFFAMLCHSFIYQRNIRNQILSILQITKDVFVNRLVGYQAWNLALNVYQEHYKDLQATILSKKTLDKLS